MKKIYIEVITKFNIDGILTPLSIIWEDGRKFDIIKVVDVSPAASIKAGGAGIRYTCLINGKQLYLFLEGNKWFVEGI